MLTKKFLASAVATIASAGAIGVAIAQNATSSDQQPPLVPGAATSAPSAATSETTTSAQGSSTSSGAGSTVSAEASPQGDLN